MKEIVFGIIGCGMISGWHADAIAAVNGCRLAGAFDVNPASREKFAAARGVRAYETLEQLLADPQIDVINICTPSGLHADLAIAAARAGKNILVEKPMALNSQQCDAMIAAARENGVLLSVVSQLRFAHAIQSAKTALENGSLGRVVCGDIYMKYYRSHEYYAGSKWRGTWAMDGGGALMNQGIHGVDIMRYIMGPVKSVYAICRTLDRKIETEDTASAVLEYESGALGVIQATTSVSPGSGRRMEFNGTKGTIVLMEDTIVEWTAEGMAVPADILIRSSRMEASRDPTKIDLDGHIRQITDVADSVRRGKAPFISGEEGRKPVRIIEALYESSRSGQRVDINV